jgi:putative nucleotidyltransferase with HDIG domain
MKVAIGRVQEVNKELWLLLSLFGICLILNLAVEGQRMVLSFYTLPTLVSAYYYGRRHATLTAFGSVLLVILMTWYNPVLLAAGRTPLPQISMRWMDITVWGGVLIVTGYAMGTLCDHKSAQISELRETYHGVLMILRHFVAKDKYTENHSYRVSIYAATIATSLGLSTDRVEDVRAAALLHDIGKLDVSRDLLYKAARLTKDEFEHIQQHVPRGMKMLEPVGGSLRRILPIVLAHHDKFDGTGYHPNSGQSIPLEARILSVADVYDSLASDRPYRKAMSPFDAKDIIVKGSGTDFDPQVVGAFTDAFRRGELEVPSVVV